MSKAGKLFKSLIIGPPGSGKGTVSSRIVHNFNFYHLSSGDILRQHIRKKTQLGSEAKSYITKGLLVPDNLITKLMLDEMSAHPNVNILLDGFPRTFGQAKDLDKLHSFDFVINLDVPFDTIIDRISKRWIHPKSGRTYNLDFNPPNISGKDDKTGEDLVQRDDDKPDSVKQRLEQYLVLTRPIIDHYSCQEKLFSFSGSETNVIWPKISNFLSHRI